MKPPPYTFEKNTLEWLKKILGDEGRLDALMAERRNVPDDWFLPSGDPSVPIVERLFGLLKTLEEHIGIVAAQRDEIDDVEYAAQSEGEIISNVIAIRTIWNEFPELWMPQK